MDEHGGECRAPGGNWRGDIRLENVDIAAFSNEEAPFSDFGAAGQFAGYETPLKKEDGNVQVVGEEEGAAEVEFVEENEDVGGDEGVGDKGKRPALDAYVAYGKQGAIVLREGFA